MASALARSSFIGRQSARVFLHDVLVKPDVRLVTIAGPAGLGKTHLAQVLLADLASEFIDGAAFIPCGELRDPDLLLPAIVRALGMPASAGSPLERLSSRLANADMLLVLDDLGQVAAAATELAHLLTRCQWMTILATSHAPLGMERELVFPLLPLPTPDPGQLSSLDAARASESMALLVQRAQASDPNVTLTAQNAAALGEICVRLDGIPLALELVAPQLRTFSPAALPERPHVPPARLTPDDPKGWQHTLHHTIDWVDRQLSPATRAIFHALSVFANGSDATAIAAVCGDPSGEPVSDQQVLGALTELAGQSLLRLEVVGGEARFVMPKTIREYARMRLETSGQSVGLHRRHARAFLALAEELAATLLGPDQDATLARFDRDEHNFRTALRWSVTHEPATALALAAHLWRFLYARGAFVEGQRWLEDALAASETEQSIPRVRALHGLGVIVWAAGDFERAYQLLTMSLSLAREIDDAWGMAAAQADRAVLDFMIGGDANQAQQVTLDVLEQFRALGDQYSEGVALAALGSIAQSQRKLSRAAHYLQDALTIARQSGDCRGQVLCLFNLGQIARVKGDLERSTAWHHEGLAIAARLDLQEDVLYSLAGIAGVAAERGQFKRAARLLGAIPPLEDWMGLRLHPMAQVQLDHDSATVEAAVGKDLFSRMWNTGRGLALADAVSEALALTHPSDLPGIGLERIPTRVRAARPGAPSARETPNGDTPITYRLAEPFGTTHGLSQRELEVLLLLAAGKSDREIAEKLYISAQTATTHVKHIRAKLAVHSRAAAAVYAIRHGIV